MDYTCKKCGNVFGDYLPICPACGTPVEPVTQEAANPNEEAAQAQQTAAQPTSAQQQPVVQQFPVNPQQSVNIQQQPTDAQQLPYYMNQVIPEQAGYYQQPVNPQSGNPQQVYYTNINLDYRSRFLAGMLAIFLGSLGIHNLYLAKTGKGMAQLCLTLFSAGLLLPVTVLWGIIDGILLLSGKVKTDGRGIPLV